MNSLLPRLLLVAFAAAVLGWGGRSNEVIVAPEVDPAAQQAQYDDYDKQQAAEAANYQ